MSPLADTAVSEALSDMRNGHVGKEALIRLVSEDQVWIGYYRKALEICGYVQTGPEVRTVASLERMKRLDQRFRSPFR